MLEQKGLQLVAVNARGDSFYLAKPGEARTIRVSSHGRTPKQRLTHPEVATSLVIREPRSPAQVERLVEAAAATYAAHQGAVLDRTSRHRLGPPDCPDHRPNLSHLPQVVRVE